MPTCASSPTGWKRCDIILRTLLVLLRILQEVLTLRTLLICLRAPQALLTLVVLHSLLTLLPLGDDVALRREEESNRAGPVVLGGIYDKIFGVVLENFANAPVNLAVHMFILTSVLGEAILAE